MLSINTKNMSCHICSIFLLFLEQSYIVGIEKLENFELKYNAKLNVTWEQLITLLGSFTCLLHLIKKRHVKYSWINFAKSDLCRPTDTCIPKSQTNLEQNKQYLLQSYWIFPSTLSSPYHLLNHINFQSRTMNSNNDLQQLQHYFVRAHNNPYISNYDWVVSTHPGYLYFCFFHN